MKPKVLIINSVCGFGSTGRIVAELSKSDDYDALVCYGRKKDFANVNSYCFANFFDNAFGALRTIFFDNNLNICTNATKRLINKIKEYQPDIIHLHNLHGYYVNIETLFKFLKEYDKPVVWTLHDCWPLTGYCAHFDFANCDQYKTRCNKCKQNFVYPFSLFKQNLVKEYDTKKKLFTGLDNLTVVANSKWTENIIKSSYLKDQKTKVIYNGIDLTDYKICNKKNNRFTVLACSSIWTKEKGIDDLNKIIPLLNKDIDVVVIGENSNKVRNCKAIKRTNEKNELVSLYSSSHILINPTYQETFGMVNIEALACGTPVITYKTGGSPETIDNRTGVVIKKGDYNTMANTINSLKKNYVFKAKDCVDRSKLFNVDEMKIGYQKLYESLLVK